MPTTEEIARALASGHHPVLNRALGVSCTPTGAEIGAGEGVSNERPARPSRRLRQDTKPLLNKLEMQFKVHYERLTGHTLIPQAIRFKLANGLWYKPDFILYCPTMGLRAFEIKGPHSFRGGFENLKMAAHQYHWIKWTLAWKECGVWQEQIILP